MHFLGKVFMKNLYKTIITLIIIPVIFLLSPAKILAYKDLPISDSATTKYIYRFWSPVFKGHFFTMDHAEANRVANEDSNWNFEQIAYSAYAMQSEATLPVYRFWSPVFHGHFYTINPEEWMRVKDTDSNWNYEWIAYYAYPPTYTGEAKNVYRFWSPVFLHHFFTIDEEEMKRVRDTDPNWDYEGIAFKVPPGDTNQTITGDEKKLIESETAAIQVDEISDVTSQYPAQAKTGEKLIATKVYLLNTGQDPIDYSLYDFILKNPENGQTYQPQPIAEPVLVGGKLSPGESVEGNLTFSIPTDLNNPVLQYSSDNMEIKNNRIEVNLDITPSVVIISSGVITDQFSSQKIVGTVKNNTKTPVRHVKITASYFDESMEQIGENFSYAEKASIDFLQPGDTADFKIWYSSNPSVKYYELTLNWQTN